MGMNRQRRIVLSPMAEIGLVILLVGVGLSAPAGAGVPAPAKRVLVVGLHQEPQILDPFATTTASFQSVTASTIEQLVYFGPDNATIEPGLATAWKQIDPLPVELKLRRGVKFSNGEEFDAESATYSIKLMMEAKAYATWSKEFASVSPVDKYTVRIKTKQPSGMVLAALARGGYVYPAKYHKEMGEAKFGTAPIGTGPYTFVEWQKGSRIVFDPNPGYWGGPPKLGGIIWRIIPEEAPRVAALQAGEVQLVINLSTASVNRIKNDPKLELVSRRGLRMFGAFFDELMDHPVKHKLVRQALNYAVDKQALVKLYGGEAIVMEGQFLAPGTPGFNPRVKAYPYDPKKAKDLLAQAGFASGFATTLSYTLDRYPLDKELGQAVAAYLEAVGLKVTQMPLEFGKYRDNFRAGPGKAGPIFQWALLTPPDPAMTLNMWAKDVPDYRRFVSKLEIDDLMDAGTRETDEKKRAEIYQKLVAVWHEDPHCIYLVIPNDIYGKSKDLKGWQARSDQVVDLRSAEF
jgi:peptide/nickel transport system substrate-binding protein